MRPAQQRLHTADPAVLQVHDGLVGKVQLAALQGAAQGDLDALAVLCAPVHALRVASDLPAALLLGAVEGDIDPSGHGGGIGTIVRPHRVADRRADGNAARLQRKGFGQRIDDALRQSARGRVVDRSRCHGVLDRGMGGEHAGLAERDRGHELVPADARAGGVGVGGLNRDAQPVRDQRQQLVARQVTQRVVDELEAVEIDVQRGEGAPALDAALEPRPHGGSEGDAVGQLGQRIVRGEEVHPILGQLGLGHVRHEAAKAGEPALAVVERLAAHGQPARLVAPRRDRQQEIVERDLGAERLEQSLRDRVALLGNDHAHEAREVVERARIAPLGQQLQEGGGDAAHAPHRIAFPQPGRRAVLVLLEKEGDDVLLLAQPQPRLELLHVALPLPDRGAPDAPCGHEADRADDHQRPVTGQDDV